MVGRVVEIATDGRHFRSRGIFDRGRAGTEVGRVALDDLAAVVANAHGLTYSNNPLVELSSRGVPSFCAALTICQPRWFGRSTATMFRPDA